MRTPAPAIASSVSESEWSVLSRSSDQPSDIEVDEESRVSLDAVSQSEGSALSFSSRLAHENADAARYFDAYRAARLDSLEHQLARRALSRTLARREAEASTMKAVLRMHTLERSLRDSGAVLQSAKDVERLLDDISVKEATLTMLNGVDKKHPNATTSSSAVAYESVFAAPATAPWLLPGVTQTPDVLAEYVSDHARRAEPYLLASRLYHAARYHLCAERLQQPSPSDVVTLIFTEPGKIVLPEHQHLIDWKHIAPIIKSIAMEANAGWLAPPWQAAMLERLIRMACGTIAMDADALRQAAKASCRSLPFEVTPEDLLTLIQSDAVQRQVDAVVREAQKIVRDNKRSSDTMSSTLKSPNAVDSLLFVYVPWYLEKHDVLTVLLKPGFITDTLAEDKQRPDQTKPDSVRGWTRLKSPRAEEDAMKIDTETEDAASTVAPKPHTSKASMTAEDHSAHPNVSRHTWQLTETSPSYSSPIWPRRQLLSHLLRRKIPPRVTQPLIPGTKTGAAKLSSCSPPTTASTCLRLTIRLPRLILRQSPPPLPVPPHHQLTPGSRSPSARRHSRGKGSRRRKGSAQRGAALTACSLPLGAAALRQAQLSMTGTGRHDVPRPASSTRHGKHTPTCACRRAHSSRPS